MNYFYYPDWSTRIRPSYFGMATDELMTTGAIALGYVSPSGGHCLREMEATDFVGEPSDVAAGNGVLSDHGSG
eukprot:gene50931-62168_t